MPRKPTSSAPLPVRRSLREVGGHVEAWRKLRGLTQGQLADRAGVDVKSVMRVEGGDSVSLDIFMRVLHALGILEALPRAVDPYETDIGRLRAEEQLPRRVRPRDLRRDDG
jgi:transcriptional regulator with XRE-family HTH domain